VCLGSRSHTFDSLGGGLGENTSCCHSALSGGRLSSKRQNIARQVGIPCTRLAYGGDRGPIVRSIIARPLALVFASVVALLPAAGTIWTHILFANSPNSSLISHNNITYSSVSLILAGTHGQHCVDTVVAHKGRVHGPHGMARSLPSKGQPAQRGISPPQARLPHHRAAAAWDVRSIDSSPELGWRTRAGSTPYTERVSRGAITRTRQAVPEDTWAKVKNLSSPCFDQGTLRLNSHTNFLECI